MSLDDRSELPAASGLVDPSGAPGLPDRAGRLRVDLVVEQLRRAVPGGIGTYATALAGALAASDGAPGSQSVGSARRPGEPGLEVTLVASRVRGPDPLDALGWPVVARRVPSRLLVQAWDRGLLPTGRHADVVHAVSLAIPPSPAPTTAAVHDLAWLHFPEAYPARGRRWHDAALRRAVRRADAFIVPSDHVAEELRDIAGGDPGRVVVVADGSDHLPQPDHPSAARRLESAGVNGPFLLAVGTLEPRKNLSRLLDAYAAARGSLPEPWPLVVVGPSGWGPALPEERAGVVLLGKVPGAVLAALYAACRCLVYVPLMEGFGLPVVEAMRAGAPVVASRVPSSGRAAHEVDPLDVDAIAAGIVAVAGEGPRRAELVTAGSQHAAGLTWAATAAAHVAVWRRLDRSQR